MTFYEFFCRYEYDGTQGNERCSEEGSGRSGGWKEKSEHKFKDEQECEKKFWKNAVTTYGSLTDIS